MDYSAIQTNITAWVEQISTLEVEWGKMPQQMHQGPFILAYAGPVSAIGQDEPNYVYNEVTDDMDEQMLGVRRMIIRLSFRSFDQRLGNSARQYAEDFRILSQSTSSIDTLTDAYLGLISTGDLVETDYNWSGRAVSQVDMDVTLGVRADVSNTLYDGSYIKNVNVEEQDVVVDESCIPVVDEEGNPIVTETTRTTAITSP